MSCYLWCTSVAMDSRWQLRNNELKLICFPLLAVYVEVDFDWIIIIQRPEILF